MDLTEQRDIYVHLKGRTVQVDFPWTDQKN